MKEILKCIGLLLGGLFAAVIIYPFLHESGHSVFAILVGAKIIKFNLIPLPYIVCEISEVGNVGKALIGLGGIVIPFIVSMSFKSKCFWLWYINLIIKGISTYAIILSAVASIFYINGISWQKEDIVQVLKLFPSDTWLFLAVLFIMGTYGLIRLLKENVFSKCIEYFNKTEKVIV